MVDMTPKEAIDYLNDSIGKGLEAHDEAIKMAVAALKKQIPKRIRREDVRITGSVFDLVCPVCGGIVYNTFNYCHECGQALRTWYKWYKCKKCGTDIEYDDGAFCRYCGTKIEKDE